MTPLAKQSQARLHAPVAMSSIALADLRPDVRHGDMTARDGYEDDGEYEEAGEDECVQLAQEAPELVRVDMTMARR
jgi:hypothetical protein